MAGVASASVSLAAVASMVSAVVGSSGVVPSNVLLGAGLVVAPVLGAGAGRSGVNIVGDLERLWLEESNKATSPRSMVLGVWWESVVCGSSMFRIRSGSVFRKRS
jgi:hypothetical protein